MVLINLNLHFNAWKMHETASRSSIQTLTVRTHQPICALSQSRASVDSVLLLVSRRHRDCQRAVASTVSSNNDDNDERTALAQSTPLLCRCTSFCFPIKTTRRADDDDATSLPNLSPPVHPCPVLSRPWGRAPRRTNRGVGWRDLSAQLTLDVVVINPGFMMGPPLADHKALRGSVDFMRELTKGGLKDGVPQYSFTMSDVRDVAQAHVTAMLQPYATARLPPSSSSTFSLSLRLTLRPALPCPGRAHDRSFSAGSFPESKNPGPQSGGARQQPRPGSAFKATAWKGLVRCRMWREAGEK